MQLHAIIISLVERGSCGTGRGGVRGEVGKGVREG